MIGKFLAILVVVLIFLIIAMVMYNFFVNRLFIMEFINGSWMDKDGNLIVLSQTEDGLLGISFATANEAGEYEVVSDECGYSISKVWLKQEYNIGFGKKNNILVKPADKKVEFYKKGKLIGEFYSVKLPEQSAISDS